LNHSRNLEWLALVSILALAAYLRLANNANTPGWYTDEGTHLDIAQHLARGRVQYLALRESTLLVSRLPLFEMLLAAWLKIGGEGMGALRTLTGALGVVSVGTLYGVVRRIEQDLTLALVAALMLAIYPQAVLYSRFGFSYNLLAPLTSLVYLGLWEYRQAATGRGWLAFTALVIGMGGTSDLWMFSLAAPMLLVITTRHWRDALWSVPLLLAPFGLYAISILVRSPQAFLFDLNFALSRLSGAPLSAQVETLALNYTVLVSQSHWLALALVGLFLEHPARLRGLALLLLLSPIAILGRTEALFNLSAYYVIPLLPLVSLGVAVVLRWGLPYAWRKVQGALRGSFEPQLSDKLLPTAAGLVILAVIVSPFFTSTLYSIRRTREGFPTIIDPFLIDPQSARQVAGYVNARASGDDVVIASPGLAWSLRANVADFQMSIAFTGQRTPHLPADVPRERFAFNPDYTQARFVVVDNLWRNWAVFTVPGVPQMLERVQTWPLMFQSGEIEVYCNPAQPGCRT
jgi:hypothetical protein